MDFDLLNSGSDHVSNLLNDLWNRMSTERASGSDFGSGDPTVYTVVTNNHDKAFQKKWGLSRAHAYAVLDTRVYHCPYHRNHGSKLALLCDPNRVGQYKGRWGPGQISKTAAHILGYRRSAQDGVPIRFIHKVAKLTDI